MPTRAPTPPPDAGAADTVIDAGDEASASARAASPTPEGSVRTDDERWPLATVSNATHSAPETSPPSVGSPTMMQTRSALDSGPAPAFGGEGARAGDKIGRFVVVERLGAGGMGVVVAAYDPTLDRKVAIKMLHGERWLGAVSRGRAQLVAEAQAMAKLSHPNVIALHEIGFDRTGAFLVMEYVAGTTLRGWVDDGERTIAQIVAMFTAAGDGLAAAHREGLIHRDFKPDNVLVDREGRARVGDFGLAAIVEGPAQAPGSRSGTLPYMAPEQLRGEPCDARADQFAFCVALWEALHGARPFAGSTIKERLTEIEAGRFVEPERRPPEWLRAVLLRGLAVDPAQRWPSIGELLAALRRDPGAARRRVTAIAAGALIAAIALWLAWPSRAAAPCERMGARLGGVWDPPRQVAVHAAFTASGAPFADAAWRVVRDRLARYTTDWTAMAGDACRANRVDGRQSDTLMDLRMACLEQRRGLLGALTNVWLRGMDPAAVEHASDAAAALAPIPDCADLRALGERVRRPDNQVQQSLVAVARDYLDALQAALLAHQLQDARRAVPAARTAADASRWLPIRAEAALAEGELLATLQDAGAEARLLEASQLADAAHDDRLRARALILLVADLGGRQQKAELALHFADLAEGALARLDDDAELRGRLLHARGTALVTAGTYDDARRLLTDARTRLAQALGPAAPETLATIVDLAALANLRSDHAGARALYEDALATATATLGPDHPQIARLLRNYATALRDGGAVEDALALYRRTLAVDEQVFGPDSLDVAATLSDLGRALMPIGKSAEARPLFERALAIRERVLPDDHPDVTDARSNVVMVNYDLGNFGDALATLQRSLAAATRTYGPDHEKVAKVYMQIGNIFQNQEDREQALEAYHRALAIYTATLGADSDAALRATGRIGETLAEAHRCSEATPVLDRAIAKLPRAGRNAAARASALMSSGRCDLQVGQSAAALLKLREARDIGVAEHSAPPALAEADMLMADAEWVQGHRAEAIRLMKRAVSELADDPAVADRLALAKRWLATHPQ